MPAQDLLLDTHTFVWWQTNDARLPRHMRLTIETSRQLVYVSAVTCWEVVTKYRLGKLPAAAGFAYDVEGCALASRCRLLPIEFSHAQATATLQPIHKDPFDRLLIAQALVEGLRIVSNEELFDRYGVPRLWESRTSFGG